MPDTRRTFLKTAALTTAGTLAIPQLVSAKQHVNVSQLKKPLAIAMWDYSWILRHHRYGEFENWDKALEGLAERGYNAIRMDAMPQFVAADTNKNLELEFRAVKDGWNPACWGNDYTSSFRPRDALCEFLPKCKKYGIKVGLASWFLAHGTSRKSIFMEKGGLQRAWLETLEFLKSHDLLDNVIYVDLLNEYPNWHGYDWLKNELNKRSDFEKFKLNNPDANLPDLEMSKDAGNLLKQHFYNDFINTTITAVKKKYPELDVFASLDSAMKLDRIDLSNFDAMDYHVWFHHRGDIPGLGDISKRDQTLDYRIVNNQIKEYWKTNKSSLIDWMQGRIAAISNTAKQNNIVCGNTEGWGPIWWFDHPELDWEWIKESAEICVDMALDFDNYKFICTSNFTHPQFKGMWNDIKWHRQITNRIKNG
jgi:hypothetical protein